MIRTVGLFESGINVHDGSLCFSYCYRVTRISCDATSFMYVTITLHGVSIDLKVDEIGSLNFAKFSQHSIRIEKSRDSVGTKTRDICPRAEEPFPIGDNHLK